MFYVLVHRITLGNSTILPPSSVVHFFALLITVESNTTLMRVSNSYLLQYSLY